MENTMAPRAATPNSVERDPAASKDEISCPHSTGNTMSLSNKQEVPVEWLQAASEHEIMHYMTRNRVGTICIRAADMHSLSAAQQQAIVEKLSQVTDKMYPNPDTLASLLGALQQKVNLPANSSASLPEPRAVRDRTETPLTPLEPIPYQINDANKLIQAGGRLVIPLEYLGTVSEMKDEHLSKVEMWLKLPKEGMWGFNEVLPFATKQLEHWKQFQQFWQWGNRGKNGRSKGYNLYFAAKKKEDLEMGGHKMVADEEDYQYMVRSRWNFEQPQYTASKSNTETLTSYISKSKDRLTAHGFTKPFKFLPDPRRQDEWTTWVEYLNLIYFQLDQRTAWMQAAERRYRNAMEELERGEVALRRNYKSEGLDVAIEDIKLVAERFNKIHGGAVNYLGHERFVRRGQWRAKWVLEEIALIEAKGDSKKQDRVDGGTEEGSTRVLRKRKSMHNKEDATVIGDEATSPPHKR